MTERYTNSFRIQEGWAGSPADGSCAVSAQGPASIPFSPDYASQLYRDESLSSGNSNGTGKDCEPCSLQWFLDIEKLRHKKYGRWIPSVLEFNRHAGETLLGLGPGLGTDWVQYAVQGASVVVCSPTPDHLMLVRRNFELRGLPGQFLHAPTPQLPIAPGSIDVVCMNSLPVEPGEREQLTAEVYRVLKPGGKVLAVVPAYYDINHWRRALLPLHYWWWKWRKGIHSPKPSYTGRELRKLFHRFVEHRSHKRHLRRADVPHIWRVLSLSCLERLLGRVLILKAFKPLSAAIPLSAAAA